MSQEFARGIHTARCVTLAQLKAAIESMEIAALIEGASPDEVYVNTSQAPSAAFTLVERTLTDGSKVYDVEVGA
jgi:hypothetical protein